MLVIRMQRTGRKGHAMFRVVVQDSRVTPTSGKLVAQLGHYDPHAKTVTLDKSKAQTYLDNGAQPSERVARLLKTEGIKLPDWVKLTADKERGVRNPEKRRSTSPAQPETKPETEAAEAPEANEAPAPETATEAAVTAADEATETPADEAA